MEHGSVVVDLAFGDSGKGLVVDSLCAKVTNPFVVRYTGGPQAGHTVINKNGKHVHSSFGSGTLRGVDSFFSKHTSVYLPNLCNELRMLQEKGVDPVLTVDPLATLITPWDVIWGQEKELQKKHGSCGIGVGAAMARQTQSPYKVYVADLLHPQILEFKLARIWEFYKVNSEAHGIGWPKNETSHIQVMAWKASIAEGIPFIIESWPSLVGSGQLSDSHIIFEGAQGVMLDQDHGCFPHVTYGRTTCVNAMELASDIGLQLDVYHVTRCYQTRHGAGPMTTTTPVVPTLSTDDEETNTWNEWQEHFVCSELDTSLLFAANTTDSGYHNWGVSSKNLVVTCLDQRPGFDFPLDQFSHYDKVYYNSTPESGNMELVA